MSFGTRTLQAASDMADSLAGHLEDEGCGKVREARGVSDQTMVSSCGEGSAILEGQQLILSEAASLAHLWRANSSEKATEFCISGMASACRCSF